MSSSALLSEDFRRGSVSPSKGRQEPRHSYWNIMMALICGVYICLWNYCLTIVLPLLPSGGGCLKFIASTHRNAGCFTSSCAVSLKHVQTTKDTYPNSQIYPSWQNVERPLRNVYEFHFVETQKGSRLTKAQSEDWYGKASTPHLNWVSSQRSRA